MDKTYDVITFVSKYLYILRKPRVANFADIIKTAIMFKTTYKKLKELEIMH